MSRATHERGVAAPDKPDWDVAGLAWPHRASSRFVRAGGLRWHVQRMGRGPVCLLVHGTAASTHSWRGLAPLLATRFSVVAPDLPGHGFTDTPAPARLGLEGMAEALGALIAKLDVAPALVVGHSAGAAILVQACLDGGLAPQRLVSLNGALLPFGGAAGVLFAPLARLFAGLPFVPRVVSARARRPAAVRRLIASTGSVIDAEGIALYGSLLAHPGHVAAVVQMMARWNLHPLQRRLPELAVPVDLVVGERDLAVPPADARTVAARLAHARIVRLPELGHLAHEEDPRAAAAAIESI
jgi:magnesium chelatase accessory protein